MDELQVGFLRGWPKHMKIPSLASARALLRKTVDGLPVPRVMGFQRQIMPLRPARPLFSLYWDAKVWRSKRHCSVATIFSSKIHLNVDFLRLPGNPRAPFRSMGYGCRKIYPELAPKIAVSAMPASAPTPSLSSYDVSKGTEF